ncbi:Vitamin B12 dependent methionine synthase, activation domain [Caloramator mitchellensis]|uniref:Vitamin B12 dependent methionine synthase, activation domain n=1 Tax=Caloramator mitchellensis TaxID=908809 RepID=A0A0R3JRJ2_CALMK|nr:hypothetical protein [Caloramator mitchellensis]KRQ86103.1 Vitamin B12 dependent methionine synthase, activation domain [Caloramator mitchellensis]
MLTKDEFRFSLDKCHVLKVVDSYYKITDEELASKIYEDNLEILRSNINPIGVFKIKEKLYDYNFESLNGCRFIIFTLISLGSKITEYIDDLFNRGKFSEGVILDAMASNLLFEYNSQMYEYIFNWASDRNLGITCRIAPGDGEIPIEYQANILDNINNVKDYGFSIVKGYALNPPKSMAYVHGADEGLERIKRLHSCSICLNENCSIRKIKEKARGQFKR